MGAVFLVVLSYHRRESTVPVYLDSSAPCLVFTQTSTSLPPIISIARRAVLFSDRRDEATQVPALTRRPTGAPHSPSTTWRIKDKQPTTTTIKTTTVVRINSRVTSSILLLLKCPLKAISNTLLPRTVLPNSHLNRKSQNTPNNPLLMALNSFLPKMTSKAFRIRSRYRSPNSMICGQVSC